MSPSVKHIGGRAIACCAAAALLYGCNEMPNKDECLQHITIVVDDAAAYAEYMVEYEQENADRIEGAYYVLVTPNFDVKFPEGFVERRFDAESVTWTIFRRGSSRPVGIIVDRNFVIRSIDNTSTVQCTDLVSLLDVQPQIMGQK